MNNLPFYILDVFAEQKYAGNQLAVFRRAASLTTEEMQRIAVEMHYSETTFILHDETRDGGFDVRIFTPAEEILFAGHPTLGTAHIIRHEILGGTPAEVVLNLKVGQIRTSLDEDGYTWMRQNEPVFGRRHPPAALAAVLGLHVADIDERFPVEEISTGTWFFIVPLKSIEALKKARVNLDKYQALIQGTESKAVLVFAPETHEPGNDLSVRMFADYYGVPEDPATGSANGCLAGYLVKNRYFGSTSIDITCEQGYEIGRPSRLKLSSGQTGDHIEVNVGGRCFTVAKGEFV
ncbi:MAG TPA: PhzF family phenazine biosynthesis protein [Anaerolineales bacterium]|nr:PhzF family phenazine biosynthesis protein [Anaerolineales bacterium]